MEYCIHEIHLPFCLFIFSVFARTAMGDPYKVPGGQQQAHYVGGDPPPAGNFHVAPYSNYPLPRAPYFVFTSKDTHGAPGSNDHYAPKRQRIDAS